MFKKFISGLGLTFISLLLTSCSESNAAVSSYSGQIRIAQLVEDQSGEVLEAFEYFRRGLEEHLGMEVVLIEGATHVVGIEAMRSGNLDLMWGSPFVYLLATRDMEVERLAVTSSAININKTLFITSNNEIQTMDDIEGSSLAFVSPGSASGYLYPMYHLINLTNKSHDELLVGDFFTATHFSGSQQASIMGVYHGDFDVSAVGNIQFNNLVRSGIVNEEDFTILGYTEIIPFPGYIAAGHLSTELREEIRNFMLNFENENYFMTRFLDENVRFVLPDIDEINHLRSMVYTLNIDLEEQG